MNTQTNPSSRGAKVVAKKTGRSTKPRVGKSKASERKSSVETVITSAKARVSKQDKIIELLRRPGGASIDDLIEATGWQPHSVRGAMSGALKKTLKLIIASEKAEGHKRIYRIL